MIKWWNLLIIVPIHLSSFSQYSSLLIIFSTLSSTIFISCIFLFQLLYFNPTLLRKKIPAIYFILFNFNPGVELIHRDNVNHEYFWVLNIPVLNCKDTHTSVYELLPGEQEYTKHETYGYTSWQSNQIKEIDRLHLTQPMIFDMSTIHCVHNPTNQPRLSLSIRTNCDLLEKYKLLQK